MTGVVNIRPARAADIAAMNALIQRSMAALGALVYSPRELDAVLEMVAVDSKLVAAGTYFAAEIDGRLVGCGGWSGGGGKLFGGDGFDPEGDQAGDAARIRAFFVEPDCARRGIGSAILEACEAAAAAAGYSRAELASTRPGEPFYRRRGYTECGRAGATARGTAVEFVVMSKQIS